MNDKTNFIEHCPDSFLELQQECQLPGCERSWVVKLRLLLCLAMLGALSGWLWAEPARPCRHIIMMDISGSLRTRGYATPRGWTPILPELWAKLFAPDEEFSRAGDEVLFCPFSDRITDTKEQCHPVGPFAVPEFRNRIPGLPFPGGGATDMARALDMGRDLCAAASSKGRSMVWLITDNENNLDSSQDNKEFYRRLRDSQDYSHVLFFPIADPKVRKGDNVVMYMMAPQGQWETPEIETMARVVTQKTGYDGILFRPLYTAPGTSALDFSKELTVEGRRKHEVTQEGGTTVLHFKEGDKLDGQLKFRIRSRLKGWKLQKAQLDDADVTLDIPPMYRATTNGKSDKGKTCWQVTPKVLTVEPQKETAEFFLLQLSGPQGSPMVLRRSTLDRLSSPFQRYLPEIRGKVTMKARVDLSAEQIKTEIPAAMRERLASVPYLSEIEHFMMLQQDEAGNDPSKTQREISWERQLLVRIEADSSPALLLAGLAILAILAGLALVGAAVLFKHSFQLEGPDMEEEVSFPYLYGNHLVCDNQGRALFWLRSRWGSLALETAPDHAFNEQAHLLRVRWEGDEFRFECGEESKSAGVFWLRRQRGRAHGGGSEGGGSVL